MEPKKNRGLGTRGFWPLLSHSSTAKELLIERLNAQPSRGQNKAQIEELRELVRDFNYIETFGRKGGFAKLRKLLEDFSLNPDFRLRGSGLDESIAGRMKRIKAIYSSMRFAPWPAFPEKDGWRFYWPRPWYNQKNRKWWHWTHLAHIYDFALTGELRLVRECDECNQWFFGRRGGTRFCPDKNCRENHWRKSAEGRAKRAAYMRDYYHKLKKEGEEALRAAKKVQPKGRSSKTNR